MTYKLTSTGETPNILRTLLLASMTGAPGAVALRISVFCLAFSDVVTSVAFALMDRLLLMVATFEVNELLTFVIFVPNVPTEDCRLVTSDALAFVPRLVLIVETLLFNELLTVDI